MIKDFERIYTAIYRSILSYVKRGTLQADWLKGMIVIMLCTYPVREKWTRYKPSACSLQVPQATRLLQ